METKSPKDCKDIKMYFLKKAQIDGMIDVKIEFSRKKSKNGK